METESVYKYLTTLPSTTCVSEVQIAWVVKQITSPMNIAAWLVSTPSVLHEIRNIYETHAGGIGVVTWTYGAVIPPVKGAADDDIFRCTVQVLEMIFTHRFQLS